MGRRERTTWTVYETIDCGKRGCDSCRVSRSAVAISRTDALARLRELRRREPSGAFVVERTSR